MRTVLRIGGSLLTQTNWPNLLRCWMQTQPPDDYFAIVGGGEAIEAMRNLSRLYPLDPVAMHWRCISMLDATFEVAAELLPEWVRVIEASSLIENLSRPTQDDSTQSLRALVRIGAYYARSPDTSLAPLISFKPEPSWRTTSDTLALLLAKMISAHRVVLFKSCAVKHLTDLKQASEEGIIDPCFVSNWSSNIKAELVRL